MSKIHILECIKPGKYRAAIHFATPQGDNSAGYSWKSAALSIRAIGSTSLQQSEMVTTMVDSGQVDEYGDPIMVEQTTETVGAGQISNAERADIVAGDIVEIVADLKIGVSMTIAARLAMADKAIAEWQAAIVPRLKWYGKTQG